MQESKGNTKYVTYRQLFHAMLVAGGVFLTAMTGIFAYVQTQEGRISTVESQIKNNSSQIDKIDATLSKDFEELKSLLRVQNRQVRDTRERVIRIEEKVKATNHN